MATVQDIRQRLRGERIDTLRRTVEPLLGGQPGAEVWLYCFAEAWGLRLPGPWRLGCPLGSQGRWLEHQRGVDPWWRGICRDAIRLGPVQKP